MKYEELRPEQVTSIKEVIQTYDTLADISDLRLSAMLNFIALIAFGGYDAPRSFLDDRWDEVVKIYDAAKAEMNNGA